MSGGCLAFLGLYFVWERLRVSQKTRSIPLRICVTGTRGKSSVTRLIASCLRESGLRVIARTTGSRPVIILPDGEEKEIQRRGFPSILEGKKLLKWSAEIKAQALVAELMSIRPESGHVESAHIFSPHILVITNVRLDHLAQMGPSREDIARCFTASFPEKGTVFVLEEELIPVFEEAAERLNTRLVQVGRDSFEKYFDEKKEYHPFEFEENIRLALAVAEHLDIDKEAVYRGLDRVIPDFGSLKVWTTQLREPSRRWHLVSLFAANDPESTRCALSRFPGGESFDGWEKVGILNLRRDRGDRTIQWLQALNQGLFPEFRKIFVVGEQANAFRRQWRSSADTELYTLKLQSPPAIMEKITRIVSGDVVLVGMGNMGGAGKELVEYWENTGRPYDF